MSKLVQTTNGWKLNSDVDASAIKKAWPSWKAVGRVIDTGFNNAAEGVQSIYNNKVAPTIGSIVDRAQDIYDNKVVPTVAPMIYEAHNIYNNKLTPMVDEAKHIASGVPETLDAGMRRDFPVSYGEEDVKDPTDGFLASMRESFNNLVSGIDWKTVGKVGIGAGGVAAGGVGLFYLLRELKEKSKRKRKKDVKKDIPEGINIKESSIYQSPLAIGAGLLGGGGGLILARALAKKVRKTGVESDIDRAQQELSDTITAALSDKGIQFKQASVGLNSFMVELENTAEMLVDKLTTKKAETYLGKIWKGVSSPLGHAAGSTAAVGSAVIGVPLAVLTLGAGGLAFMNSFKKSINNQYKTQIGGIKERRRLKALTNPTLPVLTLSQSKKKDEEERSQKVI